MTPNDITADFINEASRVTLGSEIKLSVEDVKRALDPVNFVTIRDIIGGPSPIETRRMLKDRNKKLVYDISSLKDRKEKYIYLKKLK